jgi:hypothetical protein
VDVTNGSATIRVTGAFKETLTLSIANNGAYQPSPGEFSVSYVGRAGNALIVSGTTPLGRERTSSSLTLSLVVQGKRSYVFASAEGECSITPTEASRDRFGANFTCRGLKKDGKTIDATGRFLAFA